MIRECFAEAIERLFCEAFFQNIPEDLESALKADPVQLGVSSIADEAPFKEYLNIYNSIRNRCAQGEFGLTPQFFILSSIVAVGHNHSCLSTDEA